MRTTLDIADDVLFAAKEVARREKKSVGQIISELARQSFNQGAMAPRYSVADGGEASAPLEVSERLGVYGIEPLPARGGVVSNELIDRLRDVEGI
jgi:hypothetical protein